MRFAVSWSGGRTLLIGLGGIFVLVAVALVIYFVSIFSQLQGYQAGQCTIMAKPRHGWFTHPGSDDDR